MSNLNYKKIVLKVIDVACRLVISAGALVALYLFCISVVYSSFTIPSDSMQPEIVPGDIVLVDKIVTGSRFFDFYKAARGEKVEVWRSPSLRKIKRGDVIVFNFVYRNSWDTISMNWPRYYIKRAIGIPGDTVAISRFRYIVNSDTLKGYASERVFRNYYPDDSTARAENLRGYMCDVSDSIDRWTIRDFGPLTVPAKGMTLTLTPQDARRYRKIIEWESGKSLGIDSSGVSLGGKPVKEYTFSENYYFAAGDNAVASLDSRYWGLVPEPFVVGRAAFIWWSERNDKIKWDRILKRIH